MLGVLPMACLGGTGGAMVSEPRDPEEITESLGKAIITIVLITIAITITITITITSSSVTDVLAPIAVE